MTIEQSKEKLKKEGYTWFDLNEFDSEFYEWLLSIKCNEEINFKHKLTSLRCDAKKQEYKVIGDDGNVSDIVLFSEKIADDFETFDKASEKKEQLVNIFKNDTDIYCSQLWYYSDLYRLINNSGFIKYKEYVDNLIKYYFDFEETQEFSLFAPMFTYYDLDCELKNHSDGTGTGRVCALLIYLNEEYDEKDGGCLVLNDTETVVPTFGRVAIIDLQSFDIPHMVTKVTGGIGRYAILSFVKKKEDELIHSRHDMKSLI